MQLAEFGYVCVILFMPPFFYVVYSYVSSTRIKEENIDIQLRAIDSSSIVVTMDMDGIVKSVNNNFCKSMGYNASAVKGMPQADWFPTTTVRVWSTPTSGED